MIALILIAVVLVIGAYILGLENGHSIGSKKR